MKSILIILAVVLTVAAVSSITDAGWLIYHKPEFRGKVIDADTKDPIESAVVVVVYNKHTLISGPGGGYTSVIKVKETLTDKDGEFHFPSYTTIIQPFSKEDLAEFIIFKPGYWTFPYHQRIPFGIRPVDEQIFFSMEIGSEGELEVWIKEEEGPVLGRSKVTFGIVELPKPKTREERLNAKRSADIFGLKITPKDLPLLYKRISEENKNLGIE